MGDRKRHPEKALSATFVRQVREPGKYTDGHGLILRVAESGGRYWMQRLTVRGKRCEIGIGSASVVSLAEAREIALTNRKLVKAGGDPLAEKRRAEAVLTFEEAARKVHELHKPTWKNEKHAAQFITTLETYAFPVFGSVRAAEVTTADVLAALSPIWAEKTETARRVRQRIGAVMKWCIAQGGRPDNPAADIEKALPKGVKRPVHRRALPYQEVATCLAAVRASGAGLSTKDAVAFVTLTAARSGEVREATWSEFDLHGANRPVEARKVTWIVPAVRMKMGREHRVPLSTQAIEVLGAAWLRAGAPTSGDLVFPGSRPGRPLSDMTMSKLVKELGFDVDIHGFRTSFRMWSQEQTSFPREVCEAALAHVVKDKAEAAYARSDLFEKRRAMMQAWADYLACPPEKMDGASHDP